jgi:hypothetical protein
MNPRVLLAGLLAGLTVFLWSAVSHMALPLGEIGVQAVPNADTVLPVLRSNVTANGLYLFPFETDARKWEEAYKTNPRGILVLTPPGQPIGFGRLLATEAVTNIAGGILAAFLFVAAGLGAAGIGPKLAFGAALGGFASLAIDFSYWNWYGFPSNYLAAQLVDAVVGWSLAAVVLGLVLKRR